MLRKLVDFVRGLFPASPSAPATVTVVNPMRNFEYRVLQSHRPKIVSIGVVRALSERDALQSIYALCGERVQFVGGGRYRVHSTKDTNTFTRIDCCPRANSGQRKANRDRRNENGTGGIVGE